MVNPMLKRSAARMGAVQLIYQAAMSSEAVPVSRLIDGFSLQLLSNASSEEKEEAFSIQPDMSWMKQVVEGVLGNKEDIDALVAQHLASGWKIERIDPVMLAALRAGCYELQHYVDIEPVVIINEYVDVAAAFAQDEEIGFINATLESLAKKVRGNNIKAS